MWLAALTGMLVDLVRKAILSAIKKPDMGSAKDGALARR
jgi:hypothetical protein